MTCNIDSSCKRRYGCKHSRLPSYANPKPS